MTNHLSLCVCTRLIVMRLVPEAAIRHLREAVSYDVFRWCTFENRLSVSFQPGMTVDLAAGLIAHTKYDACRYSVARKITMKHRRAFPADGLEHQNVGREQQVDRAGQFVLSLCRRKAGSWRFVSSNDLQARAAMSKSAPSRREQRPTTPSATTTTPRRGLDTTLRRPIPTNCSPHSFLI